MDLNFLRATPKFASAHPPRHENNLETYWTTEAVEYEDMRVLH